MTFTEMAGLWEAEGRKRWSLKVAENVRRFVAAWNAALGERTPGSVSEKRVRALASSRIVTKSGSGANQERAYFRQLWRWARERGFVAPGKTPEAAWPRQRERVEREYRPLSPEQEEAVCAKAPGLARAVRVGIRTGLRLRALQGLEWRHITDDMIVVPAELTKEGREHRIPLTRALSELLQPWRVEGIDGMSKYIGTRKVFPELENGDRARRQLKAAGGTGFHDLRRTFVQRLAIAGVPAETIAELGNWKSPDVMIRHYTCKLPTEARRAFLERI